MRLKEEVKSAGSVLGSHSAKKRFAGKSAEEKSEAMRQLRLTRIKRLVSKSRKDRPKASDAWHTANAMFRAENIANRVKDRSFKNVNESFGSGE